MIYDTATVTLTSNAWGWHNRNDRGVISTTDQLIFQNGSKALSCIAGIITMLTSLLIRQPSTITYCDRFDKNRINIDKTESPIPTERSL